MKTLNQATLVCPPVRATSYHLRRHARQIRRLRRTTQRSGRPARHATGEDRMIFPGGVLVGGRWPVAGGRWSVGGGR
jgi:hypothetical protein